jgi:2-oxoglutarate ferredoxin oxidoreductase subunit beta
MSTTAAVKEFKPADYKSELKSIWCPGCGDFAVVSAMYRAFAQLKIPNENLALVSGIGCSSRLPGYVKAYGFNTIHGRALPIATGLKLARPELTVVLGSGDGDAFSIGAGHLPHAARRNIDMTLMVMDNNTYGLTKGQMSPTTPLNDKTASTLYGVIDTPIRPIPLLLTYGVTFVARAFSGDLNQLTEITTKAIQHKGFSVVQVLSPCVTFRGDDEYDRLKGITKQIPATHDTSDWAAAMKLATEPGENYLGIFYQNTRPAYDEMLTKQREIATKKQPAEISALIESFK